MDREESRRWIERNAVIRVGDLARAYEGLDIVRAIEAVSGLPVTDDTVISHSLAQHVLDLIQVEFN